MLGLQSDTPTAWVESARSDLTGLLSDHAHCEVKAAHTALSLVAKYGGEYPVLVTPLAELAAEETGHFQLVSARLNERGATLQRPAKDEYVNLLRQAAKDLPRVPVLLDRLLISALVEARSCERFRLLSEHLPEQSLRGFYRELMASEARHYRLFRNLAEACYGGADASCRFTMLAKREAEIADRLPLGPTVHG